MVLLGKLACWISGEKTGLVDWLMWPGNTTTWWQRVQDNVVAKMSLMFWKVQKAKVAPSCPALWDPTDCTVGQNTGVGSLSLLQGTFPTQGLNPGLPHCRQILYQLCHKGSPFWNKTIKRPSAFPFCSLSLVTYTVVFFSHLLYLEEIYCNRNSVSFGIGQTWVQLWAESISGFMTSFNFILTPTKGWGKDLMQSYMKCA